VFGGNPDSMNDWIEIKGNISNGVTGGTARLQLSGGGGNNGDGLLVLSGSNTFNGAVEMIGSNWSGLAAALTVSVERIGSIGDTWSNLGAPQDATNGILHMSTAIALRYTGTGEPTDRVVNMAAAGQAIIENNGTGPLTFTNSGTTTVSGASTLVLKGSYTGTNSIAGFNVTNASSITKDGAGTWVLTGTSYHTGGLRVNSGTLLLDMALSGTIPKGALTLAGGNFEFRGAPGTSGTQTFGTLYMKPLKNNKITLDGNGGDVTVTLDALYYNSRYTGDSLLIDLFKAGPESAVIFTAAPTGKTSGDIYAWMLVKDRNGDYGFGTDSGVNTPIGRYQDENAAVAGTNTTVQGTNYSTRNSSYNAGGILDWETASGRRQINTLTIDTTISGPAGHTLAFGSGTLDLYAAALLFRGTNDYLITGGRLGDNGRDIMIHQTGKGVLSIDSEVSGAAGGITKSGEGVLWLKGNNVYTGFTVLNAGILRAVDGVGLPANSPLSIGDGVLESSGTFTRSLVSSSTGITTLVSGSGAVRVSGGRGGFSAYGDTLTVAIGGTASPTTLVWGAGPVSLLAASTRDNKEDYAFNPTILVLNEWSANKPLDFTNPLDLNGAHRTIEVSATHALASATISGIISHNASSSGDGRNVGITKTGVGLLVLSAHNTYKGETIIQEGRLDIAETGSLDSRLITANSGATLGGNGLLKGDVNMKTGSTFNVDFSLGTLMTIQGDMNLLEANITLNFAGFTDFDDFLNSGYFTGDEAKFANLLGSFTGSNFAELKIGTDTFNLTAGSFTVGEDVYTIGQDGNGLYLTVEPVPEPTTWALLAGGLGVLALLRRRR